VSLVADGDAVLGAAIAGGRSGDWRIRAKKVILATNGFAANADLVRRHCPDIAGAPYFGAPGSAGEAIEWGDRLGADLANLGAYQAYATLAYPAGSLLSWTTIEMGGIVVNGLGRRFGDETAGYSGFAAAVLRQNEAYALFDTRIRDYAAAHELEVREMMATGALREFDTAAVSAFGLDGEALRATIDAYNAAASGAAPDPYGRREFGFAPLTAPFVLCQVIAGLFHTQGGLRVDHDARVLRRGGGVIGNLFAGGGAAAGVSGRTGGAGYSSGSGLLAALGLGRIAGKAAALEIAQGR
jgi:fumarate reductase flavoprotein subunit